MTVPRSASSLAVMFGDARQASDSAYQERRVRSVRRRLGAAGGGLTPCRPSWHKRSGQLHRRRRRNGPAHLRPTRTRPEHVANYRTLCDKHIIPGLGARKLRELSAKEGRPPKALTLNQAETILKAAIDTRKYAYVVLPLLTGARTEELRALASSEVDLDGAPGTDTPPWTAAWRSTRESGDTTTRKSRRSLALPRRCVEALQEHRTQQARERKTAGTKWKENDLVFASLIGTPLDSHNTRRAFRKIVKDAGLPAKDWVSAPGDGRNGNT
jgi:hypothetical protein